MNGLGTGTDIPAARDALAAFLTDRSGADRAEILALEKLAGGTLQENWRVSTRLTGGADAGTHEYVVRTNRPGAIPNETLTRPQEFAVMRAVHDAGMTVPEPLWLCDDESIIGRTFFVMRFVPGTASPQRLVKEPAVGGTGRAHG